MNQQLEYKPTEGEEFVADFLDSLGIDYEPQKIIYNLEDKREFRVADFYLEKYKIYIEFFGKWNNSGNDTYREKKGVYFQNNIPCVYLYPENLGIIDFIFDKRIQEVLVKNKMKKELLKYRFFKLRKSRQLRDYAFRLIVAILIFIYWVLPMDFDQENAYLFFTIVLGTITYQIYEIIDLILDVFKRNKFPLSNVYRWSY